MKPKAAVSVAGDAAYLLLELAAASSDFFGPLKSATGGALHIAKSVKGFRSNGEDWDIFGRYVVDCTACVVKILGEATGSALEANIEKFKETLKQVEHAIERQQEMPAYRRLFKYAKDPDFIKGLRLKVDNALSLFQLGSSMTAGYCIPKVLEELKGLNLEEHLVRVQEKFADKIVNEVSLDANLKSLAHIDNASWNLSKLCLEGTRTVLLEEIMHWVDSNALTDSESEIKRIFFLTSVAGGGKSTIAHSLAKLCHERGILAAAFFFSRDNPERPRQLFSTLARDLAGYDPELGKLISLAIKRNASLPSGSWSNQFRDLILEPSLIRPPKKPLVVIWDALDEGYDEEIFRIIREEFPKLPPMFRIFLTCREGCHFNPLLSRSAHVHSRFIDIYDKANLNDIADYATYSLRDVAVWKNLGELWPGPELSQTFISRAEGLFLWVATVCQYLRRAVDPKRVLVSIIEKHSSLHLTAEKKMDELYSAILQACNWDDIEFGGGYNILLGAIMAAKSPLTAAALQELHHSNLDLPVGELLQPISSLLTGMQREDEFIQPLHLSFRDFITVQARAKQYHVDPKTHSQRLAYLCLSQMNLHMNDTPRPGYLSGPAYDGDEVPKLTSTISDAMRYSCLFWIDHIVDVEEPDPALMDGLRDFLGEHVDHWIEISASEGHCRGFSKLRCWINQKIPGGDALHPLDNNAKYAEAFLDVSIRLISMNRIEEAADAACESVVLYDRQAGKYPSVFNEHLALALRASTHPLSLIGRSKDALDASQKSVALYSQLTEGQPSSEFNFELARSLHQLSKRLSELDHQEDALESVRECVALYLQLVKEQPPKFIDELAQSLRTLSVVLSNLGHPEKALEFIRESVTLFRQLANERPSKFSDGLAESLGCLSDRLSALGLHEEALDSIRETITLYRQLVKERPPAFKCELAESLSDLSTRLAQLGHLEDTLELIQESVALNRQLVKEQPSVSNPDLARSLHVLSNRLSELGHREDALNSILESAILYRQLAEERPSVLNRDHLARSLHSLSNRLSELGHREDALDSVRESAILYRRLAEERPLACNPGLADILDSQSNRLSELGYREDALDSIQESATLFRQLAKERPSVFNPGLAGSLHTLSNQLSKLGHREDALDSIRESATLYRQLAEERPSVFNPGLAGSLHALSNGLSELGHREDALGSIRESARLYRQLAEERPSVFNPGFAGSLNGLSIYLSDLGHLEEALDTIKESVNLFQQLAEERPAAFNGNLAISLINLTHHLSDLAHHQEAMNASQKCLALLRQLALEQPAFFNPFLSWGLKDLANHLLKQGERTAALVAIRESVEIRRQLAEQRPAVFSEGLAWSLDVLSTCLSEVGERDEALATIREAIDLRRQLAAKRPAVFNHQLAASLHNLSCCLSNLERKEEALKAIQEAVELRRQLAAERPALFNAKLSLSLGKLSSCLSELGSREEALLAEQAAKSLQSTS